MNYSYLSDGTKLSALDGNGEGLVYRGPFAYIDFGARQYSPSLRRWMTPDPLSEKYYGISPYAFCNNNPVNFVDPDGERLCFADNVSDEFKQKFMQTFAYMIFRGTAGNLLRLHLSDRDYYIYEAFKSDDTRFEVKEGIQAIFWDPYHIVENHDGVWRSPATTLAHEAGHAVRYDDAKKNGTFYQWKQGTQIGTDPQYDTIEEKIVITTIEQDTARKHGEIADDQVTRTSHKGHQLPGDVKDKNPWEIQKIVSEHNELLR